ncbi:N-acetyltransferase [Deinococcus oregonensis]|uniref:N-acetyltransferase n=1 Tax=Deinococcus oregonensis TaxID=1805970 RepID=A0ABV6AY09_9DEIO
MADVPGLEAVLCWCMVDLLPHLTWHTPTDLHRLAQFLTAAHPDAPTTAAELERLERGHLPGEVHRREVLQENGVWVGLYEVDTPRSDSHEGWLSLSVWTLPTHTPLGELLLAKAEALAAEYRAHTLLSRSREDWWELPLLQAHGYREHDRMWSSTLDLTRLDFAAFAAQEQKAQAAGIQIRPLSELGPFDEAQQFRLYTLIAALLRDVPSTSPVKVWPFETWQLRIVDQILPEGLFVAIAPDGEWVGMNELYMVSNTAPRTLRNGLTGVLVHWRGNGIAYALKLASARAALTRGFTHVRTGNHSINAPMLAINGRLGFVREAAW